mgnify:FL=1
METLDLHGIKHQQVDEVTRNFLNFIDLPCQVVTGNSEQMKAIVRSVVREYEWFCYEKSSYNHGTLVITERNVE